MIMRIASALCTIALLGTSFACSAADEEWIQLFNGRDLSGWTPKVSHYELGNNFGNTFRVEDGLLQVRYDQYKDGFNTRFGHLFYAKPYSYYRLRIEYRFAGKQIAKGPGAWANRNSGIMFHAQPPQTMTKEQDFPISIEAQLLGGLSARPRTCARPGRKWSSTARCTRSIASTLRGRRMTATNGSRWRSSCSAMRWSHTS